MIHARILIMIGLLCFAGSLAGQKGTTESSRVRSGNSLAEAESLRNSDPEKAIELLAQVIQARPASPDLVRAYSLLGDIYVDIDQYELALNRYRSALSLLPDVDASSSTAGLYLRIGQAEKKLERFGEARSNFGRCIDLAPASSAQNIACKEGLGDVEASLRNLDLSQTYYDEVGRSGLADSTVQVRINTKRAEVSLEQGDLRNSIAFLNSAVNSVPQGRKLTEGETRSLLETNVKVRKRAAAEELSMEPYLPARVPVDAGPVLVTDNFARFEIAREVGNFNDADDHLAASLTQISAATPLDVSSRIYAEAADYYLERERTGEAARAYRAYTVANDAEMEKARAVLARQVAILKAQQNFDLGVRDLAAEQQEATYLSQRLSLQRWLIYLLVTLLIGALASVIIILRNVRRRRRANQELMLRNLQARMNPHFIFNSLNSINNYIARQDERSANRYLGRFARLMRKVLDQSGRDFIPLSEELGQLELYLELESERFAGNFIYHVSLPDDASDDWREVEIPPMILQPYVENAIWHGLRYLESDGQLAITVRTTSTGTEVVILDNGIGRVHSASLKTTNQLEVGKRSSMGMDITRKRLELINDHYSRHYSVQVEDAFPDREEVGTRVTVTIA